MSVKSFLYAGKKFLVRQHAPDAASERMMRSRLLAQVKAEHRPLSITQGWTLFAHPVPMWFYSII